MGKFLDNFLKLKFTVNMQRLEIYLKKKKKTKTYELYPETA